MDYKLQISETAESNIDDILTYMLEELKAPGSAKGFLGDVYKTYKTLAKNPYIYSLCRDDILARQGYRMAIIKKYLIFYQVAEDTKTVKIASVMYGGRNYSESL